MGHFVDDVKFLERKQKEMELNVRVERQEEDG